ncbi:MAG: DUF6580 family putative transport protein [Planctomycetaceae bacterium]
MKTSHFVLVLIAATVAASMRLVPMPIYNFSAISAFAILAGTVVRPLWFAVLLPVAVRLLTDCLIHLSTGYGFYSSMSFDYAAYVLIAGLAYAIQPKQIPQSAGTALLATAVFFAVSNFGAWCMPHPAMEMYPRTVAGLMTCYQSGLPFLKGTLISDMVFTIGFIAALQIGSVRAEQPVAGEVR